MSIEQTLSRLPAQFRKKSLPPDVITEAKKRVLDTLACFYGAYNAKPGRLLRGTLTARTRGECTLWGSGSSSPAELAAWANGTCVRTLDYNDTYLSKEPCHPSDLIASLWAACEISKGARQGRELLRALVLAYEVVCRLCDARSIRARGWDHVTYLPAASAVGCSYILGLSEEETRNAVALAMTGNNALRQTRVGVISDWKAACAAYAARSGLWAARLARAGFTGPHDIFSGRNGFFRQVSGPFHLNFSGMGRPWKIMETHTKYFPAEHHSQSAIEAALALKSRIIGRVPIRSVTVTCFDAAVEIIGSEKEKWAPATRETADHSLPYLVAAALLDGKITLSQYERRRFADRDIRALMSRTRVTSSKRYSSMYPKYLPTEVSVTLSDGRTLRHEVLRPRGYAGRPMTQGEVEQKFERLAGPLLSVSRRRALARQVSKLEKARSLRPLSRLMEI